MSKSGEELSETCVLFTTRHLPRLQSHGEDGTPVTGIFSQWNCTLTGLPPVLEMPESLSSTEACSAEVGTLSSARPPWWARTQRLLLGSARHLTARVTVPPVCTRPLGHGGPDIENRSITDLWNWEN